MMIRFFEKKKVFDKFQTLDSKEDKTNPCPNFTTSCFFTEDCMFKNRLFCRISQTYLRWFLELRSGRIFLQPSGCGQRDKFIQLGTMNYPEPAEKYQTLMSITGWFVFLFHNLHCVLEHCPNQFTCAMWFVRWQRSHTLRKSRWHLFGILALCEKTLPLGLDPCLRAEQVALTRVLKTQRRWIFPQICLPCVQKKGLTAGVLSVLLLEVPFDAIGLLVFAECMQRRKLKEK